MVLSTSNSKCDEKDRYREIPSVALILLMRELSDKYCNRGFAVLFDVDC